MDPLQFFLAKTQRLVLSPQEYGEYLNYGWDALPDALMCQVFEKCLSNRPAAAVRGARLSYIRWSVQEEIDNWKRSIGPCKTFTSDSDQR